MLHGLANWFAGCGIPQPRRLIIEGDDLERWVDELERNEIDKSDFESLVRGQKDLAQMKALKQVGLAQVSIDTFTNGVLDIVINAAFAAIKL